MEDPLSWDELFPFMAEVKALARNLLRREHQASLQTTALVLTALRRQRLVDQDWGQIGIGRPLTVSPLPHHQAYGSVPWRFDVVKCVVEHLGE